MNAPKISIITPTYQAGTAIETALKSVASQTYPNIEHLIVDCASRDNTLPTVRKFQKEFRNIRLLTEKDGGIYDAMNKGLDLCSGDWIFFLGADDSLYDEHVLTDLFEQGLFQEEQVVYGNVQICGDAPWAKDGTVYDGPFTLEKLFKFNICHQSIFYPRSVVKKVGYYNTKYKVTADWDYNIHCWASYHFIYVDRIISRFATGGKSSGEGDYSLHLDFPQNVIRYFSLDVNDGNLYLPTSPFYYPMMRYREIIFEKQIAELSDESGKLRTETDELKHALAERQSEHERTITALRLEHENSDAGLRQGYDEAMTRFMNDQATVIARLKNESEDSMARLREDHSRQVDDIVLKHNQNVEVLQQEHHKLVAEIRNEYSQILSKLGEENAASLARLKDEYGQFAEKMREDYRGVIDRMKDESARTISDLRDLHAREMQLVNDEHRNSVAGLREGFTRELEHVQSLNNAQVQALKDDHAHTVLIMQKSYDEVIRTLQAEQRASWDQFHSKEQEFMQVIDSNGKNIEHLKQDIARNEEHYLQSMQKAMSDIESLKAEVQAHKEVIASMVDSVSWRAGRFITAPFRIFRRS